MADIALSGVVERDIDFLLLEELAAAGGFFSWFLGNVGLAHESDLVSVTHSATSATGETDIEVTIKEAGKTVMLLVENKIDANLQPRQPERYRERARRYVDEGQCTRCYTVLIAPRSYLAGDIDNLGFDHAIPYEDILSWFDRNENLGQRRLAKIALLRRAIDRGSAGWKLVPDQTVTEFWRRYWELSRTLAPELGMARPDIKPAASTFIYFRPAVLSKGTWLVHKLPYGNVDLQLRGKAVSIEQLRQAYGSLLEPGMTLERAGKSAVIRLSVPPIDMRAPFPDSEPAVREALWAAKLLHVWYKRAEM